MISSVMEEGEEEEVVTNDLGVILHTSCTDEREDEEEFAFISNLCVISDHCKGIVRGVSTGVSVGVSTT